MLKQRVITALVLVAILLPALFAPMAWPFAVLSLVLIAAAGWEWGRLNGAGGASIAMGVLLAALCAAALWAGWGAAPPQMVWWVGMLVWVLGGTFVLRGGVAGWPRVPMPLRCAIGLALLWTAWLALAAAKTVGVNFILSVFCLVWAADIAAYFGGKAFGKRKLAPGISPGKSWAGVWSGMLGALVLAAFWLWLDGAFTMDSASLYTRLFGRFGVIGVVGVVVFLAAMSVVGDLFESLVKRAAGAKDSSNLLPGHGGVLDRVDALLPVFPIAMALVSV
ncbi:phosphatidate cytidylyltransferase [Rhizobacter sp. Root404]|uniref:phosphatidate cytidylyltransferase n=1 Tax=Rhizobacter sp. Root404 TaxID=1736528 RepID=UPI0006F48277|nr:phosphatidate cytidylyltransferase [Rhizobacter sp. Root404]KQW36685.1 phosphatidate cytidylyltransferase [Rhizobacter sp. Root404]